MWRRSSQALLRKLTVKVGSGVGVSVTQRRMSTVMTFGSRLDVTLRKVYEPTPILSLPSDIVSVHAGHYQSFALTSHGQLWAWGCNTGVQYNDDGFLDRESWNEPKRVEGLENVKVCTAFPSRFVSAAIGDDGSVWVWGKSEHGQLGVGKHITEVVVPARVEALSGENIANVHSLYVNSKSMN